MHEGIIIACIAGIVEFLLLSRIKKEYNKALKAIPFQENFKERLNSILLENKTENKNDVLIFELCNIIGLQHSATDIRIIIKNNLTSLNEKIRHYANLGPAIGLFFTFIGMLLLVYRISLNTSGISESILNSSFNNLYPVFVGGATGILVYGIGMILLNRLEKIQLNAENELLLTFFEFENEHDIAKPKNIEEAYNQLLKPLTELIVKLKSINYGFQKFADEANNLVNEYSKKTDGFIQKINASAEVITVKTNSNTDSLVKITQNILNWNSLFNESAKQWKDSAQALSKFSNSLSGVEERLNKIAKLSEDISDLTKNLNSNSLKVNDLIDWVEKDRLEFKSLKEELGKFIGAIPKFTDGVEQLKLGLTPLEENFNLRLLEVNKNLSIQIDKLFLSHSDLQKTFVKELSEKIKQDDNSDLITKLIEIINIQQSSTQRNHSQIFDQLNEINTTLNKISQNGQHIDIYKSNSHHKDSGEVLESSNIIKKITKRFISLIKSNFNL